MNNFSKFKSFLNERGFGVLKNEGLGQTDFEVVGDMTVHQTQTSSIFSEQFVLMKELFKKCNVTQNVETYLVPSDRQRLFSVLVQAMLNVTEYVTGPCLINQLKIYNHYTYLWNGVLSRVILDIDSDFYQIKLATLNYIKGLLQGLNPTIVDYLSHQLKIQTFYDLIVQLIRLLFIKVSKIEFKEYAEGIIDDKINLNIHRKQMFANYNKLRHFDSFKLFQTQKAIIDNPDSILQLYKLKDSFNSHLVIEIVAGCYVLMRSVADKVKFWHLFLRRKENTAKKWQLNNQQRENDIIFNFVLKMMFSVEIVYEVNEVTLKNQPTQHRNTSQHRESKNLNVIIPKIGLKVPPSQFLRQKGFLITPSIKSLTFKDSNKQNFVQEPFFRLNDSQNKGFMSYRSNMADLKIESTKVLRVHRRLYFQTPPMCLFLTKQMKEAYMEDMPIRSTTRKQIHMYKHLRWLMKQAESHKRNFTKYGWAANLITGDAFDIYEMLIMLVSIALNIALFFFYINPAQIKSGLSIKRGVTAYPILVLTYLQMVISFMVVQMWIQFRWYPKARLEFKALREELNREPTKWERFKCFYLDNLIFNKTFSSFLINFAITLIGTFVYEGLHTLNIFLAVKIFKPMTDIIKAIFSQYQELLVTFLWLVLLIYVYGVLTALFLSDRIMSEHEGPENCRDLISCFMNSWNLGLRASGGLGESFDLITDPTLPRFWLLWIVNISYLVIVKFVIVTTVTGITVESFGELRERRDKQEFDRLNFCPVCGMDRWQSEREQLDFQDHIQVTHNPWNYFKFLVRLNSGSRAELVGYEFEVMSQFLLNHTYWFPNKRFLTDESGYVELVDKDEPEQEEIDIQENSEDEQSQEN